MQYVIILFYISVRVRVERRSHMPAPPGSDDDDEGLAAGLREVELSNGCRTAPYPPPGCRRLRPPATSL
jgi:hypothetical protein